MSFETAHILYLVFALGGAGIYLLLPKSQRSQTLAGAVVALLAVAGLAAVLAARVIAPSDTTAYFYLFSLIAVVAAVRVITHPKPVYSAIYFVLVVVAVAALLVLLRAEFLAVALIIIYAGAILVTYLFVIMLANQSGSPIYDRRSREPFLAVLVGFVLMAAIAGQGYALPDNDEASAAETASLTNDTRDATEPEPSNTTAIGALVMTRYVVSLEMAGILLLISMVGAIALSRKKVPTEGFVPPPKPIGQIGREVEPF